MSIPETAHFKFLQSERLNIIKLSANDKDIEDTDNSDRKVIFLSNQMSGSVIIADMTSGSFTLKLPKPESGLNYRIIIKTNNDSKTNTLHIESTSNNYTVDTKINLVGGLTEDLNKVSETLYVPTTDSTENNITSLNIFSGTNIQRLHLGTPFEYKTGSQDTVEITHSNNDTNQLYNTTGDYIELICDGEDWYGNGFTKNRSIYKHNGTRLFN